MTLQVTLAPSLWLHANDHEHEVIVAGVSLLAALGVVLLTYWLGRRLFDADTSVVTALPVATTLGLYHIAHSSMPYMVRLIAGTGAIALCIGCDKAGPSAGMPQVG